MAKALTQTGTVGITQSAQRVAKLDILNGSEIIILAIKPSLWYVLLVSSRWLIVLLGLSIVVWLSGQIGWLDGQVQLLLGVAFAGIIIRLAFGLLQWQSRVYILTNLRVYWDQAFFALADAAAPEVKALKPRLADLHYRGFSTPFRNGGSESPHLFDYTRLLPVAPWNAPEGLYTRFGEVRGLVEDADNRLVVMAPGDELTVAFDAQELPPIPSGWTRDFFLHFSGWAKDNDPNTTYFRTVEPLPYWGMESYFQATGWRSQVPAAYLESYQTRRVPLLIAPLAPPK